MYEYICFVFTIGPKLKLIYVKIDLNIQLALSIKIKP